MAWTCPECKRTFARNKQAHSCESYDLDPLFIKSNQGVRGLYEHLLSVVSKFGIIDVRVGSFNISIRNLSTFLIIIPERDHLTLGFMRDEPLDEFPVYQNHEQSKHRCTNHIKVESKDEIDKQLINWLKDAYNTTG